MGILVVTAAAACVLLFGSALDGVKKYEVCTVYDNGVTHPSATYEKLMQYILDEDISYRVISAGDIIPSPWNDITLNILSPQKDLIIVGSRPDINENSVVMKVTYKDISYLLTGGAEKKAKEAMLAEGMNLNADILKAGHQGSYTSSTKAFLNVVIVISFGEGNEYGHPHKEPMKRFVQMTKHIYRTDMDRDVVVTNDGTAYSAVTRNAHGYEKVIWPNQPAAEV